MVKLPCIDSAFSIFSNINRQKRYYSVCKENNIREP